MSFRLPRMFSSRPLSAPGSDALDAEVRAEKAAALGRAGRQVEQSLSALRSAGEAGATDSLFEAADAVHHLIIQREACGLWNHSAVLVDFDVPAKVLGRGMLGVLHARI